MTLVGRRRGWCSGIDHLREFEPPILHQGVVRPAASVHHPPAPPHYAGQG